MNSVSFIVSAFMQNAMKSIVLLIHFFKVLIQLRKAFFCTCCVVWQHQYPRYPIKLFAIKTMHREDRE